MPRLSPQLKRVLLIAYLCPFLSLIMNCDQQDGAPYSITCTEGCNLRSIWGQVHDRQVVDAAVRGQGTFGCIPVGTSAGLRKHAVGACFSYWAAGELLQSAAASCRLSCIKRTVEPMLPSLCCGTRVCFVPFNPPSRSATVPISSSATREHRLVKPIPPQ